MEVTSSPPPSLRGADVAPLLASEYGLEGVLTPLVSERDQNFRLDTADDRRYVVKVANAAEPGKVTRFQVAALRHLEREQCPVAVPRVVPTLRGDYTTSIKSASRCHIVRVVTWVSGTPLVGGCPDSRLAWALGETLARIDAGLQGFEHAGENQALLWDMQRAGELRDQLAHIPGAGLRARVSECLDNFETCLLPQFPSLRRQVIHNDLNPGNVLVSESDTGIVTGVIDFGDMLRAPLVVDVAIAASYLRSDAEDALEPAVMLVAGFDSVTPLTDNEIILLRDLMRTRLVTTITMMYWRIENRTDGDEYLQQTLRDERSAERFLDRLEAVTAEQLAGRVRQAGDR